MVPGRVSQVAFFSGDDGAGALRPQTRRNSGRLWSPENTDPDDGWAWSPDSTRIAFVSPKDGDTDIYVTDVESGTIINCLNDSCGNSRPRWSPTGSHIAYDVIVGRQRRSTNRRLHRSCHRG